MPQDLYQWEVNGGLGKNANMLTTLQSRLTCRLVHHCPICYKPLTTPQARSRCLGEHVEWCKRYHTQLFKKGQCLSCLVWKHGS